MKKKHSSLFAGGRVTSGHHDSQKVPRMPASPSDIANSLKLKGLHKAYGQMVAARRVDLEIDTPV